MLGLKQEDVKGSAFVVVRAIRWTLIFGAILLIICWRGFEATPHNATVLYPDPNSLPPPAVGQVYEGTGGDEGKRIDAFLAQSRQITEGDLARIAQAQTGQVSSVKARKAGELARRHTRLMSAILLGAIALGLLLDWVVLPRIKSLKKASNGMNLPRSLLLIGSLAILALTCVYPIKFAWVGSMVEYHVSQVPVVLEQQTQRILKQNEAARAEATTHWLILEPASRANYGYGLPAATVHDHMDKVIHGQAIPQKEAESYQLLRGGTTDRQRAIVARSAKIYAILKNGPSWFLSRVIYVSQNILQMSVFILLFVGGLSQIRLHPWIIRGLGVTVGVVALSAVALPLASLLLTIYSWLGVGIVVVTSYLRSPLAWSTNVVIMLGLTLGMTRLFVYGAQWSYRFIRMIGHRVEQW